MKYDIIETDVYYQNRYDLLLKVEGTEETPYVDSKGLPTIGIGYELRTHFAYIYEQIIGKSPTATPELYNQLKAIVSSNYAPGSKILSQKLNTALEAANFNDPSIPRTFSFSNDVQMKNVLNHIQDIYEYKIDKWLNSVPDSEERAVLFSLAYNQQDGKGALLGLALKTAIQSDNRAEAWYEIRYNSNLDKVQANRRYVEANRFELYDDRLNVDSQEAAKAATMYTIHRDKILSYEKVYSPFKAAQVKAEPGIGDIYTELKPAITTLKAEYRIASTANLEEVQMATARIVNLNGDSTTAAYNSAKNDDDFLIGSDVANVLKGDQGNDALVGLGGADKLYGGTGNDTLLGGSGNDIIDGGAGSDRIDGGTGSDTLTYADSTTAMVADLTKRTVAQGRDLDTYSSIERLIGTSQADRFTLSSAVTTAMRIDGGKGADVIDNKHLSDMSKLHLSDSGGDIILKFDTYDGSTPVADHFWIQQKAVAGVPTWGVYITTDTTRVVSFAYHADTRTLEMMNLHQTSSGSPLTATPIGVIKGVGSKPVITLQNIDGKDVIHLSYLAVPPDAKDVQGTAGNDALHGSAASDALLGGGGNDALHGSAGADLMNGGAGADTVIYATSLSAVQVDLTAPVATGGDAAGDVLVGIENITGSNYGDALTGNAGANILTGGAGNDLLIGGGGGDRLIGGTGSDTVSYARSLAGVRINLRSSAAQSGGDAAGDVLSSIEHVVGSAHHDTFYASSAANHLTGGNGSDTVSYSSSTAGVMVNLTQTTAQSGGMAQGDILRSIENLVGSTYNDSLMGDGGANQLTGGAGNDSLYGGAGNDLFTGGTGSDYIEGGAGIDTVSYASSADWVYVDLGKNSHWNGDARWDNIVQVENITGSNHDDHLLGDTGANTIRGGAGNDAITGREGNDVLDGGAGNDSMHGGTGNDILIGGDGADLLDGGTNTDTVTYASATSRIVVNLSTNVHSGAAAGDSLISIENIIGTAYNDQINGNSATNWLQGGAGNDVLISGTGNDTLTGGTGADTYRVYAAANAKTVISDFNVAQAGETIQLLGFSPSLKFAQLAIQQVGSNSVITFTNGQTLTLTNVQASKLSAGSFGEVGTPIQGTAGNDTITGTTHAESIRGLAGNDVITGGGGADTIDGGDGFDRVNYTNASAAVAVNLAATTAQIGSDAAGDILLNVEAIDGSAHNDKLTGNASRNEIDGDDGNDTIAGGAGADTLYGGNGIDTVTYAASSAAVQVSLSDVDWYGRLLPQSGGDAQGDIVWGFERMIGSDFDDSLSGSSNNSTTIWGGLGNDLLSAGDGGSALYGGDGDDIFYDHAGNDVMDGGNGDDRFNLGWNGTAYGQNTVDGGAGTDYLNFDCHQSAQGISIDLRNLWAGGDGSIAGSTVRAIERLNGTLSTSNYNDTVYSGDYKAIYNGEAFGISIYLGNGNDFMVAGVYNDKIYGGDGNDTIYGGAGDDLLDGGSGASKLYGNAGNDTVIAGSLSGTIDGGVGTDVLRIDLSDSFSGATIDLRTFIAGGTGIIGGIAISGIELINGISGSQDNDIVYTGNHDTWPLMYNGGVRLEDGNDYALSGNADDVFWGDNGNDTIESGAGNDQLYGGAGNDSLNGGTGNDFLYGGAGDDVLNGGDGTDGISYASAGVGVSVNLSQNAAQVTGEGTDTLISIENLIGSYYNDTLTGSAANNIIQGGSGKDLLRGGDGNDTLYGNSVGADADDENTLYGGNGNDRVIGGGFNDVLYGDADNDTIEAEFGADRLYGGVGDDILYGHAGSDTLHGELGRDTLSGDGTIAVYRGADYFTFTSIADSTPLASGQDTILDFSRSDGDKIDLSAMDAIAGTAANDTFTFIGNAAFSMRAGELHYMRLDGNSYHVEADVDGNATSDFAFTVTLYSPTDNVLLNTDFIL